MALPEAQPDWQARLPWQPRQPPTGQSTPGGVAHTIEPCTACYLALLLIAALLPVRP
jgi:hypothetical protein